MCLYEVQNFRTAANVETVAGVIICDKYRLIVVLLTCVCQEAEVSCLPFSTKTLGKGEWVVSVIKQCLIQQN